MPDARSPEMSPEIAPAIGPEATPPIGPEIGGVPGSFVAPATRWLGRVLPDWLARSIPGTVARFMAVMGLFTAIAAAVLYATYLYCRALEPAAAAVIVMTLWIVFAALLVLSGIGAWLIVLAQDRRHAAEREIAHHTAMLREEIAAHTRTDRALQKAKDAAEAANAAKSRYLVAVSHEIRSPLNAIYGYAQLLEREGAVEPVEAGRVIHRSSEHLANLVDGLLEISRIESGVLRLNRDTVPLPAFLDQIVEMFRMQAHAKGLELRYTTLGRLPAFVRTDEKRFRQILINLLSNAVKYTRTGHAALTVGYRSQIAEITVADSGVGIAPEDLERIFEPFERGGSPETKAQPGIGLGLAITRVLTHIMGGEITVASELGVGTRFTLRLMLPEPMSAPPATVRSRWITGYEGRRRTILLVDDDVAQLTVLQGLLRPLGFDVHVASNGEEGIARAQDCRPDLVLLDIQMPGLSGWETAARLRAAQGGRLRIVMCSANAHEFSAGNDGRAHHDSFVVKPVDLEVLLDAVAEQLGLTWTTREAPVAAPLGPVSVESAGDFLPELRKLGKIGHIRGISAKLDEMVAARPESRALAARLRACIEAFDIKAFLRILEGRDG